LLKYINLFNFSLILFFSFFHNLNDRKLNNNFDKFDSKFQLLNKNNDSFYFKNESNIEKKNKKIFDYEKIEKSFEEWLNEKYEQNPFTETLNCVKCNLVGSGDLSKFENLSELILIENKLEKLDLSKNLNLKRIYLFNNYLSEIDFPKINSKLSSVTLAHNNFFSLDFSQSKELEYLFLVDNSIKPKSLNLNLYQNKKLKFVSFYRNNFTAPIDYLLSKNINLTTLVFIDYFLASKLDLKDNINLTTLVFKNSFLNEIDLSKNKKLTYLDLSSNSIREIDLSNNQNLVYLDLQFNQPQLTIKLSQKYKNNLPKKFFHDIDANISYEGKNREKPSKPIPINPPKKIQESFSFINKVFLFLVIPFWFLIMFILIKKSFSYFKKKKKESINTYF
jgi:hypothetical protein